MSSASIFMKCAQNFPYYTLWKEVTTHSPQLRSEDLCSPSLREENLHKLFGLLHRRLVSSPLIVYLITYLYHCGLMDIYFIVGLQFKCCLLCSFGVPKSLSYFDLFFVCVFFKHFLYFWHYCVYFLRQSQNQPFPHGIQSSNF